MSQLGERLRAAREARGLSLADAATATRILPRYIQALENGDFQSLPGDVYARGFLRNYAQLLDLPSEELILLYRQERGESTGKIKVVPAAMPPRNRSCLVPSFWVAFAVILVLVAVGYFAAESLGMFSNPNNGGIGTAPTKVIPSPTPFPTSTEPPTNSTPSALPPAPTATGGTALFPTATAQPGSTPQPGTTAEPNPSAQPTPASGLVVAVSVVQQTDAVGSWLEVRVDGVPAFNQLLRTGQSQQWTPQREIFLNIGDTSLVVLTVNGQTCPGFPGAVRGVPRRITISGATCP